MIFVVFSFLAESLADQRIGFDVSTALVESSRIKIFGLSSSGARAIQRRCFCPQFVVSTLDNLCIVTIRKFADEPIGLCQFADILYFFIGSIFVAPASILS